VKSALVVPQDAGYTLQVPGLPVVSGEKSKSFGYQRLLRNQIGEGYL